jgi:hypothetical protein
MSPPPDRFMTDGSAAAIVGAYVERLRTRARLAAAVEAVSAGAHTMLAAALIRALVVDGADPLGRTVTISAGVLAAIIWALHRRRTWTTAAVAERAETRIPVFRNALVTAVELDAHPDRASARIRDLVARQAASVSAGAGPETIWPTRRFTTLVLASIAAVLGAAWLLRSAPLDRSMTTGSTATGRVDVATIADVALRVLPPAYTGRAARELSNVEKVDVLAGSRLMLTVRSRATRVELGYSGRTTPLASDRQGFFEGSLEAPSSGLLTLSALDEGGRVVDRRALLVTVREDAPPEIVIERPGTDLAAASASDRLDVAARATDDLGLARLTLHYTKVTGSGEQFSFDEGELPWKVAQASPREWRAGTSRVLSELGLAPGDLLVYYAKAADGRPGAPPALSDSYVIEVGKPQEAVSGGFALPPDQDREGLSLSALIQKTERLDARREAMAPAAFAEAARGLAIEQRMVRTEVLFLMGEHGHVEDEEAEAAHSSEIQEGRLENRGQTELMAATRLMTSAESHLTVADTRAALTDQRRALAALQRVLSRQRYFLKTMPVRSRIDPSRRLSGDLSDARSWERAPGSSAKAETPDGGALDAQRAVLEDLARASRSGRGDSPDLAAIGSRLLALDPGSTSVQDAAAGLVRASSPGTRRDLERDKAIDAATKAVLAMSRQAPASGAVSASRARAALHGALVDALDTPGGRGSASPGGRGVSPAIKR